MSLRAKRHDRTVGPVQMSWRHDVIAETWQAICRDAGLSAHLKQKAAEFAPGDYVKITPQKDPFS